MLYSLCAEDFTLNLEPEFFPEDAALPVNVSLRVRAESGGFAGSAVLDVGLRDLHRFAADLERIRDTLSGTAALVEPYGPGHITFSVRRRGAVVVQGYLRQTRPGLPDQELRFAECLDQSCLEPFSAGLRAELRRLGQGVPPEARCS